MIKFKLWQFSPWWRWLSSYLVQIRGSRPKGNSGRSMNPCLPEPECWMQGAGGRITRKFNNMCEVSQVPGTWGWLSQGQLSSFSGTQAKRRGQNGSWFQRRERLPWPSWSRTRQRTRRACRTRARCTWRRPLVERSSDTPQWPISSPQCACSTEREFYQDIILKILVTQDNSTPPHRAKSPFPLIPRHQSASWTLSRHQPWTSRALWDSS